MENNNYIEEHKKRKEKIFIVNYFDKKEMRWYDNPTTILEEEDINKFAKDKLIEEIEEKNREKYINVLTGEEYDSLAEANQAKLQFLKEYKAKELKEQQEEAEELQKLSEKKKESVEGSKGLEEAKKIGVNEEEEIGEIAEAGE